MASLKKIAECLGLSGGFSVLHDFLGYRTDFNGRNVSLLRQVLLLKNRYINLNIIRVGIDNFSAADEEEIDFAIQTTRDIYAAGNLGVGRIDHYDISVADAAGSDVPTNDSEVRVITDKWSFPNASPDVFFVLNGWAGTCMGCTTIGKSAIKGPCDKVTTGVMTGSVITIRETISQFTGQVLAHELGHYLGLSHVCEFTPGGICSSGTCQPQHETSLMYPCAIAGAVNLSNGEFQIMNNHCFVNAGCAGN